MAAANQKLCSIAVPDVAGVIRQRIATGQGEKVASLIWQVKKLKWQVGISWSYRLLFETFDN